jgi:hypothetical protein
LGFIQDCKIKDKNDNFHRRNLETTVFCNELQQIKTVTSLYQDIIMQELKATQHYNVTCPELLFGEISGSHNTHQDGF